jgi:protoporphyrinogen oxidase
VLDGLKRSLGLNKRPNDGMATKTLLETFRYPRLGPGMMWEAARDKVIGGGNHVLMAHSFKQLTQDQVSGRWRLTANGPDGDVVIDAAHVISSAPMRELAARIHPLPACALTAAPQLKYRDFLTVALKIRSEDLFPDNWIYIHDSKVQVGRVQNFRSWSPENGSRPRARVRWPGVFLLRGRRAVGVERRRADCAGHQGNGDPGAVRSRGCCGRRGGAAGKGLSGL